MMSEMPDQAPASIRLFTALPVAPAMRQILADLPPARFKARWVPPVNLHITLRFLGDIDPARLPDIEKALGRIRQKSFNIEAGGLDIFQSARQSVLYVPIISTRKLTALAADIGDVLSPLGFDFGTRPYVPHITLARLPAPVSRRPLKEFIARHHGRINASWRAQEMVLMRSDMQQNAPSAYQYIKFYSFS